jgi:sugar O-acyltransferase (sialic acid O-acetyltransferase NeuD family)
MKKTVIFGAGGFGREVKMLLDQIALTKNEFNFYGYYDDGLDKGTQINNHKVLGNLKDLSEIEEEINVIIAIASPDLKIKVVKVLNKSNFNFPKVIHPNVLIGSEFVSIGRGTIVCAGCIITCNIEIEEFVILNLMCTVGHNTIIKSYSSFMPSVNISGEVLINEKVYVGTGAKIINQIEIGKNTIVGAGAVVSKSLPDNCTAVGIPAKPIKYHE